MEYASSDTVTVFRVRKYDVRSDEWIVSRRYATATGAAIMGGQVMGATQIEIQVSELEHGEEWTPRGFDPAARRSGDFQTQIRG